MQVRKQIVKANKQCKTTPYLTKACKQKRDKQKRQEMKKKQGREMKKGWETKGKPAYKESMPIPHFTKACIY